MITPLHELIIEIITDFLITNDNSRFVELITQLHELVTKIITDFLITNDNSRFVELITQLHELIIEIITDFLITNDVGVNFNNQFVEMCYQFNEPRIVVRY